MEPHKKNWNSPFYGYSKTAFPLLRKIPEYRLHLLFKQYMVYGKLMKSVQLILLVFSIIVLVHNFLIFSGIYGNGFEIQDIIIGVLVLFLVPCIVIIVMLLKGQMGLRRQVKKACLEKKLPVRKTRKEFNQYVKVHMGGYGI